MGIRYVNGSRLKHAVIAAAQRVLGAQEDLDNINVFPVPDGDTGTNMALTLKQVAEAAIDTTSPKLGELSASLAEAALIGARGNSGAILAQFFQGLAQGFQNLHRADLKTFARAASTATTFAEQAIAQPVEGTILSVMKAWSSSMQKDCCTFSDIAALLQHGLMHAAESLAHTPEQLPVLAQAGVVDAGGQGFVYMLEGVTHLIETGAMDWTQQATTIRIASKSVTNVGVDDVISYTFCTECLIEGSGMDLGQIRLAVSALGDSLIVAGSSEKAKIHIHTNEPEALFEMARQWGSLTHPKAENMRTQQVRHQAKDKTSIALITDSSCDLPSDYLIRHGIKMVPVTVSLDGRVYQDRINITTREIYRQMSLGKWPKTSQPTPASFQQALSLAQGHHKQAIGVFLSSKVSGTFQAAQLAAKSFPDMDIRSLDSYSVAGALGHLVRIAAESIEAGYDLDTVEKRVLAARPYSRIFASIPTLEQLVRGGRVSAVQGWLARMLKLVPIFTFNASGSIEAVAKSRSGRKSWSKVFELTVRHCELLKDLRFSICHASNDEAAQFYSDALCAHFKLDTVDILNISPTVGAHTGLGAAAICVHGIPIGTELPS